MNSLKPVSLKQQWTNFNTLFPKELTEICQLFLHILNMQAYIVKGVMQMKCAWQEYLDILPIWMRYEVDKQGRETLLELRLRLHKPVTLITTSCVIDLEKSVSMNDIEFCINMASKYSPWNATSITNGYITASGGHRIGICGQTVNKNGDMTGIRFPNSLCIRVARDYPGIAREADGVQGSILVIGPPGSGKTTLLRDLIRRRSFNEFVSVVDEREEIFPLANNSILFQTGKHTDVLSGCSKMAGIDCVLRSMSPNIIAVDEITAQQDCDALIRAGRCGVKLLATAHATCLEDLDKRPIYRSVLEADIFDTILVMHRDRSWNIERMKL